MKFIKLIIKACAGLFLVLIAILGVLYVTMPSGVEFFGFDDDFSPSILSVTNVSEIERFGIELRSLQEKQMIYSLSRDSDELSERELWNSLSDKYSFLKLGDMGGVVSVDVEAVRVTWGSGMVGTWGIMYSDNIDMIMKRYIGYMEDGGPYFKMTDRLSTKVILYESG